MKQFADMRYRSKNNAWIIVNYENNVYTETNIGNFGSYIQALNRASELGWNFEDYINGDEKGIFILSK